MSKVHNLAGIIGQRETAVIASVVDEITAKPSEQFFLELMPPVARPEYLVYSERVSGFGGVLKERVIGEEGKHSSNSSSEIIEFSGGAYQESKRFTERDLIAMRRLGTLGDRGITGLNSGALDMMSRAGADLKLKLENRLNLLARDAIFNGTYTYMGITKANFFPPSSNTVQAASDWSVSSTATPFTDLFNIVNKNPLYFKYHIKYLAMNPVTAAAMLTSEQARLLIQHNYAAQGDVNKISQILFPGLPEIRIVRDAYQEQTETAGRIVNAAAQYFLPDYKILAVPDFGGLMYGQFGEIQMLYNINDPSSSVERPAIGIYSFVDEEGLTHRKAPWVDVVTGFNGGPNLMRSNDVLIIKVKAGI